jgi:ribonucleoside-diphosphate reductase alpha chain
MTSDYVWLTEMGQKFLENDYLLPGQTLDERVDIICETAARRLGDPSFAARFKENIRKGWYSFSTPIWANFGTTRGLPISCFGSAIGDSIESILSTLVEVGTMTKHGGGTSGYFGLVRPRGSNISGNGKSFGSVHFMQLFDNLINIISQGSTRRGQFAAYLPVEHKDIQEFLTIRSEGSPLQDISFGVTVTNAFMQRMIDGESEARRVWAKILESRANTGYPYVVFIDNANEGRPEVYKEQDIHITHSNLCSEIMLPDNEEESFVCDLSSMNILHFDAWKNTDAVELLTFFLDIVMEDFIEKTAALKFMERANRFARRHRALGIGWVGYHSFLQSKMVPFESFEAKMLNIEIARTIKEQAYEASKKLATKFGEPEVLKGYGRRNTTLCAIAPTKSSAFILGQISEGIEPHRSNYYIRDLEKGKFTVKNPHLETHLTQSGRNTPEVWESILHRAGSVQHLDFLSEEVKAVFKTFQEISPKEIVIQAAARQKFIDQGQSLNLMIHPATPIKEVNQLYLEAWRLGIKSLYYQHSINAAQKLSRSILECTSCAS